MAKKKFYVVWEGIVPGVYSTWDECKDQISGYNGAVYKSFLTSDEAYKAFNQNPWQYLGKDSKQRSSLTETTANNPAIIKDSLAVDAACSGNPGLLEYRGVYVLTGEQIFYQKVSEYGTNNVGEFLALVHGLAFLKKKNLSLPIYSDSANAIKWIKEKKCKTKLERIAANESLFGMLERAEKWLRENTYTTRIIKWETSDWGEIPADFGRK